MRKFLGPLVFALLAAFSFSLSAQDSSWERVSSFQYDWDHHGLAAFVFEQPTKAPNGGGDFTRIRIQVPGQKEFILDNDGGWVNYTNDASVSKKLPKTLTPSESVLAVKAAEDRTLLFLFGYGYASSFGQFDALEISIEGQPRVVIHREEFMLEEVRDLDGDGIAEIVGKTCMSQTFGDDLLTYDPFNVYKLSAKPGDPAKLSLPLSKNYNLRHYYGWAGPDCSEDFTVVLHPPGGGRPVVVRRQEAEKMTARKQ